MNHPMIRVGIGGWNYAPWRGTFYPDGLAKKRELEYATRAVSVIEINATFHGPQKPQSFANWAAAAPDGFVFALKASKYICGRRVLAEAEEGIARFLATGVTELGDKLGPILWQFPATKKFDADDFGAFLKLLPAAHAGVPLRHALHVRHESFVVPDFVAMAREAGAAIAFADSASHPAIADLTADFVYARLENAVEAEPAGYSDAALATWTRRAREWATGGAPAGLPYVTETPPPAVPRETFVFFINGAKVRAPAGAMAMLARLSEPAP